MATTILWSIIENKLINGVIDFILILVMMVINWKANFKLMLKWLMFALFFGVTITIAFFIPRIEIGSNKANNSENNSQTETNIEPTGTGEIVVEGETGVLTNGSTWSYIGESARGGEAYLGDDKATATYEVTAKNAGKYNLYVKLSDDAMHMDGARSVTITVNTTQTLKYTHVSEDTQGWKWYKIGTATLKAGKNTIAFVKDESTGAAYVMDTFKLIPEN